MTVHNATAALVVVVAAPYGTRTHAFTSLVLGSVFSFSHAPNMHSLQRPSQSIRHPPADDKLPHLGQMSCTCPASGKLMAGFASLFVLLLSWQTAVLPIHMYIDPISPRAYLWPVAPSPFLSLSVQRGPLSFSQVTSSRESISSHSLPPDRSLSLTAALQ